MKEKIADFKASDPGYYRANRHRAEVIDIPDLPFVWIDGEGDPNGREFAVALTALYGFSYALRMNYRDPDPLPGAHPYVVAPLEATWTIRPGADGYDPSRKVDLVWCAMIRQPEFLDKDSFRAIVEAARTKFGRKVKKTGGRLAAGEEDSSAAGAADTLAAFDRLEYGRRDGGRYAQILHIGPYDDEPDTFARLEVSLVEQGFRRSSPDHREIYLSDPRKSAPERLRTILRVAITG